MIPLRDTIPSKTIPFVTYFLLAANILVFLFELSLGQRLGQFVHVFGVVPERTILILTKTPQYLHFALIPFFSSIFLHGGWFHLLGNMLFLHIFGNNVEDALGHIRYLIFYVGSGIAASLVHLAAHPSSGVPTIGASGAIAGVMGAYFLLYPHARVVTLIPIFFFVQIVELPAFIFLGFWFLIQFLSGSLSLATSSGAAGVAWWAHIGGFAVGVGYVLIRFRGRVLRRRIT
ncbi:MAG: rhomboid family intramembrane serine protease [bacterium]|nr:MAG: rhomboid family intramembrane serine protease [bacterium]